jgi:hypothetical protein
VRIDSIDLIRFGHFSNQEIEFPLQNPDYHLVYGDNERFIVWYCGEPRLGFDRSVVVRYRSFLESLSLSAATINLHLTAIRRLADEATERVGCARLVTGIRRVKGVKRLGRKIGNSLTGNQAQKLLNAVSQNSTR